MLAELINQAIDLARQRRARRRLRRELEGLDDDQLRDIGIRRRDIPRIVAGGARGRRVAMPDPDIHWLEVYKRRKGLS